MISSDITFVEQFKLNECKMNDFFLLLCLPYNYDQPALSYKTTTTSFSIRQVDLNSQFLKNQVWHLLYL